MGSHLNIYQYKDQISIQEIAKRWFKFRDTNPNGNADLHLQYCELIQEAIWLNQTNEASRLLQEGTQCCGFVYAA